MHPVKKGEAGAVTLNLQKRTSPVTSTLAVMPKVGTGIAEKYLKCSRRGYPSMFMVRYSTIICSSVKICRPPPRIKLYRPQRNAYCNAAPYLVE